MSNIDAALSIAIKAHTGQTDRDDEAYILHPLAVGLMGKTDEERMAGFLHDVLEDSSITADELLDAGIPESVVNALKLLTHDKNEPYSDYVERIIASNNPIALRVKFNDLTHNVKRGEAYPELQAKHKPALERIKQAIDKAMSVQLYTPNEHTSYAIFAAGCFWGVQHYFERQKGVIRTFAGYTGGTTDAPTYDEVRAHHTDHLEAILVEFNANEVSYESLCKLFFEIHDPAQTDGQGPDKGSQYLSGAFYNSPEQLDTINRLVAHLRNNGHEVNTRIASATKFWVAEQLHQNYYERTGGSPYCHIRIKKF